MSNTMQLVKIHNLCKSQPVGHAYQRHSNCYIFLLLFGIFLFKTLLSPSFSNHIYNRPRGLLTELSRTETQIM